MIEHTIRDWVKRFRLSGGDDLLGFVMDCEAYLEAQDAFLAAEVKTKHDQLSMVNGAVSITASVPSLQDVADAFKAAWTQIAYSEFEATSMRWYEEATLFRFITGDPNSGLGVTGTFIAGGDQYSRLVDKFRIEFGDLGARVERMPGGLPPWAAQLPHAAGGGRVGRSD
jgi:hypothetical protein